MRTLSLELKKAIEKFGFKPIELEKNAIYEVNTTYWCNYWDKWYKDIDVKYECFKTHLYLKSVTIKWQDGKIATHCTNLDRSKDWKLLW